METASVKDQLGRWMATKDAVPGWQMPIETSLATLAFAAVGR